MKKRIISLLLAMIMVLGMIPMTALAEEACDHASTTESVAYNGDKTHNVSTVCADCGEAVANMENAVVIDFKADAEKAAAEFAGYANLQVATHYATNMGAYVDIDGVRLGSGNDAAQLAASDELNAWLEENANWSFSDEFSGSTPLPRQRTSTGVCSCTIWSSTTAAPLLLTD